MALFGKKGDGSANVGQAPYPDQGYAQDPNQYAQYPQDQQQPPGPDQQGAYPPQMAPESDRESMEEVVEAVVEEKWKEKKKELGNLVEWKEEVNTKLAQLQQQIDDLKASFDGLHKGILGKITEYDENLNNVGTEIKAMGKVFSKVLPSFTESVNKLQRMGNTAVKKKV
ncbi:MAG: hypothetical protein U9O94_05640 [Nanoarchaeota archaeon]|nr:hypothetical protein [Nanoarchaeota archaeon]